MAERREHANKALTLPVKMAVTPFGKRLLAVSVYFAWSGLPVIMSYKGDIYLKPIPPGMQRDRSTTDGLRGQELYTNLTLDEILLKSMDGIRNDREMFWLNRSLTEWEKYTCIRFKPAGPEDDNVVKFQSGDGCYTDVGMAGGEQVVNLERPTCRWKAIYMHMLGHVIGLVHEHQLPNRDRYLSVHVENVDPSWRLWLQKYNKASLSRFKIRYDPSSIMHYGEKAFSSDGYSVTLKMKNKTSSVTLGRVWRQELSFSDVKVVNLMYKCRSKCPKDLACSRGGFVTDSCKCLCPDGSDECQACTNSLGDDWRCSLWANQGECTRNRDWMTSHCQRACHVCAEQPEKPDKTKKKGLKIGTVGLALRVWRHSWEVDVCKDVLSTVKCQQWSLRGECLTNVEWMKLNCQKSCRLCPDDSKSNRNCINGHLDDGECNLWAQEGECQINKPWMTGNCRQACQACAPGDAVSFVRSEWDTEDVTCYDKSGAARCLQWRERGECRGNDRWMTYNCRKTCDRCDDGGCKNLYSDYDCEKWKSEMKECEKRPAWMRKFCKLSCGHCKPGTREVTPIPYQPEKNGAKSTTTATRTSRFEPTLEPSPTRTRTTSAPCENKHNEASCKRWAETGHCQINVSWMSSNCRKACGVCQDVADIQADCADNNADCRIWAKGGYCQINPALMLRSCRKSCNKCQDACADSNSMCPVWGRNGYCLMTPGPMYTHCPKTCGICSGRP